VGKACVKHIIIEHWVPALGSLSSVSKGTCHVGQQMTRVTGGTQSKIVGVQRVEEPC
jgi:hypothetical protein